MYRKFLLYSSLALVCFALFVVSTPFFKSLLPNDASLNAQPHFDLSNLDVGKTIEYSTALNRIFITKMGASRDQLVVLSIPTRYSLFLLPEFDWSRPVLPCKSFVQDYGFQCLDEYDNRLLWYHFMKWDNSGKYIGENKWGVHIPDFSTPKYKIQGRYLILLSL